MSMYFELKFLPKEERTRTIDGLLRLRKQLSNQIPARSIRDSLMLATWNIRDFGAAKLNPSPRLTESLYYMAEIVSAFDLIAVQEVNANMKPFLKMMDILGAGWSYIATDVCESDGGNGERMAFVYDKAKVSFRNIAGEIVLPKKLQIGGEKQFARTPFLVKFQSGWCRFTLNTVHLFFGAGAPGKKQRIEEIDRIAGFLAERAEKEEENYILLGDMNIVSPTDDTMKALKKHNFVLPSELVKKRIPDEFLHNDPTAATAATAAPPQPAPVSDDDFTSNMNRDKFYDQIAFYSQRDELELGKSKKSAGVFNYYDSVFREEDFGVYHPLASNKDKKNKKGKLIWGSTSAEQKKYFTKSWRTWQMSDHLPLWTELNIDFTEKYLKKIGGDL